MRIVALLNPKAKAWITGRKNVFTFLENSFHENSGRRIWMHCASLGEFEQGRPILERWRKEYPEDIIVLTFFSPSGYQLCKNYSGADVICYLPMDSKTHAEKFLRIVNPAIALFVKYEFWHFYLKTLHQQKIPIVLFSAIFRKQQIFFSWYGKFYRSMLKFYSKIFVQTADSKQLLAQIHIHSEVAPDTRFDRVSVIAEKIIEHTIVADFIQSAPVIIGGSTWLQDEKILLQAFKKNLEGKGFKLIIAPHEVQATNIIRLQNFCDGDCALLSSGKIENKNILIVDTIGQLAEIYRYAKYVFIGGAFGNGLHNILEAAVYGKPIFFGPEYAKFNEAVELQKAGAAFAINSADALETLIQTFENDSEKYITVCRISESYVKRNAGGTEIIFNAIKQLCTYFYCSGYFTLMALINFSDASLFALQL